MHLHTVALIALLIRQSASRGLRASQLLATEDTDDVMDEQHPSASVEGVEQKPLTIALIRSGVGSLTYHPQTLRYTYTNLTLRVRLSLSVPTRVY